SSREEHVLQRTSTDRQAQRALRRFEAKRQKLGDLEFCHVYGLPERFANSRVPQQVRTQAANRPMLARCTDVQAYPSGSARCDMNHSPYGVMVYSGLSWQRPNGLRSSISAACSCSGPEAAISESGTKCDSSPLSRKAP